MIFRGRKRFFKGRRVGLGRFPAVFFQIHAPAVTVPVCGNAVLRQKRALQIGNDKVLRPAQLALTVDHPKSRDALPGQILPQSVARFLGLPQSMAICP